MSIEPQGVSDKASDMPPKPDHCEFGATVNTDEVFGRIVDEGPNYRNVSFLSREKKSSPFSAGKKMSKPLMG